MGANGIDIMRLVLLQGFKMTIAGVSLGLFGTLLVVRVLMHLVEGMQPANGVTFAIIVPLLPTAALLASLVPARRASMVDPVRALRQE